MVWGDIDRGKPREKRDKKEAYIMASVIQWFLFSDRAEINVGI